MALVSSQALYSDNAMTKATESHLQSTFTFSFVQLWQLLHQMHTTRNLHQQPNTHRLLSRPTKPTELFLTPRATDSSKCEIAVFKCNRQQVQEVRYNLKHFHRSLVERATQTPPKFACWHRCLKALNGGSGGWTAQRWHFPALAVL